MNDTQDTTGIDIETPVQHTQQSNLKTILANQNEENTAQRNHQQDTKAIRHSTDEGTNKTMVFMTRDGIEKNRQRKINNILHKQKFPP